MTKTVTESPIEMPKVFDINMHDSVGYVPDYRLQFTNWRHFKNKKVYRIVDFIWNSEFDRWVLLHKEVLSDNRDGTYELSDHSFVRTPENFFGRVRPLYKADSVKRFEMV